MSDSNDDSVVLMSGQFLAAAFKLNSTPLKLSSSRVQQRWMRPSAPSTLPSSFNSALATLKEWPSSVRFKLISSEGGTGHWLRFANWQVSAPSFPKNTTFASIYVNTRIGCVSVRENNLR
jgi:hypothetical protein